MKYIKEQKIIVNKTLKEIHNNKTIGIIVSRKNDEYIIRFSTDDIISTTYELILS